MEKSKEASVKKGQYFCQDLEPWTKGKNIISQNKEHLD